MKTIDCYNKHVDQFTETTLNVDMESLYQPFCEYLPKQAIILDLGCGSGRDTLAFKNKGYEVDAIDYSEELVKKAIELTSVNVRYQSFYDLDDDNKYDGIWACASLLHCDREKLPKVLERIYKALRRGGICYMSFKYGNSDRKKDGRSFTDIDEYQAKQLLNLVPDILLLQQWITVDKRPD